MASYLDCNSLYFVGGKWKSAELEVEGPGVSWLGGTERPPRLAPTANSLALLPPRSSTGLMDFVATVIVCSP